MFLLSDMKGMPLAASEMMLSMHRALPYMMMCEAVGPNGTQEQYDRLIASAKTMFGPKYYEYPERALQQIGITVVLAETE